ncbi:MAG: nucleotidyltransferase family protein [Pseudomonadota bacterium]
MNLGKVSAIVLASGASRRFGGPDKLSALLDGKPVAQYVAECVAATPIRNRYFVARQRSAGLIAIFETLGFETVVNPNPEAGQGASLALGARRALQDRPEGVLVCLADMPFVTPQILHDLGAVIGASDVVICGPADGAMSPPALFSFSAARALADLRGDSGAQRLIRRLDLVSRLDVDPRYLRDIDTQDDLKAAGAAPAGTLVH